MRDLPRLPRLRVRYATWPRPAVELTDTPRPGCESCDGVGEYEDGAPVCNGLFWPHPNGFVWPHQVFDCRASGWPGHKRSQREEAVRGSGGLSATGSKVGPKQSVQVGPERPVTNSAPGREEPDHVACGCWDPSRAWPLLPVPRALARRRLGYRDPVYSDEPPF